MKSHWDEVITDSLGNPNLASSETVKESTEHGADSTAAICRRRTGLGMAWDC